MEKIAIYGLSTETERNLTKLSIKYDIVGLLDGFRIDGHIYGLPIIRVDDAINLGITKVIVVARPGSCKAIVRRIGDICKQNNVQICDIKGNNLLEEKKVIYDFESITGCTKKKLIKAIEEADAISFDLFDTLVVRNVLFPTDIIEILSEKISEKKKAIPDFFSKRIAAEKQLSLNGNAPKLIDIYKSFCANGTVAEELANEEFNVDLNCLRQRTDVAELVTKAKRLGKKIYITSNTYYSKEQITRILEINKIKDYDGLLLSCDVGTSKSGELYEILKNESGSKNILHIGDDIVLDVEKAVQHGIKAIHIYSAMEFLYMLGGLGLNTYAKELSDRIKIGIFIAEIFNSPFQFENASRKLHIDLSEKIGYLIFAPIMIDFTIWLKNMTEKPRFSDVLFCARDGYLIKQLYEMMHSKKESIYFLTSRISAIRAGMSSEHDIEYVDGMKFSGTVEDNLKCRFGIEAASVPMEDIYNSNKGIMAYSKPIIMAAKIKKENNLKYIDSLNLGHRDVAFFDFVAKGTSQMYVQKLIQNHLCGFYFIQLEPDYMKDKNLEIESFYTQDEIKESIAYENYYILETILTSPDPSVVEFTSDGKPIYSDETRTENDLECFIKIQEGVIDYTQKYLSICPLAERRINKKLDEAFLKLIHNVEIRNMEFLNMKIEDTFFNRTTNLTDVL